MRLKKQKPNLGLLIFTIVAMALALATLVFGGCSTSTTHYQQSAVRPSVVLTKGVLGTEYKGRAEVAIPANPTSANPIKIDTKPETTTAIIGKEILKWSMVGGSIMVAVAIALFFTGWFKVSKETAIEFALIGASAIGLAMFWQAFMIISGIIGGIVLTRWAMRWFAKHPETLARLAAIMPWKKKV